MEDVCEDLVEEALPPYATPNPHPARAIYGFALWVCAWISLVLYLAWALLPSPWLSALHLTYVPAKYWAIAVPLLFPIAVTVYVTAVFAVNLINFHGVFDNVQVIDNDFGDLAVVDGVDLNKFLKTAVQREESRGGVRARRRSRRLTARDPTEESLEL